MSQKYKIFLILPSLASGGMERVMTELAHYFSSLPGLTINLLVMTQGEQFYTLPAEIKLIVPPFDHRRYSRPVFTLKTLWFVRQELRKAQPDAILSFGGWYNAFVLLAAWGLGLRVFVSDRSRPSISYGPLLDRLNPIVYRRAAGIIAQTQQAQDWLFRKTRHPNITIIGNPIRKVSGDPAPKERIILNVGRFIASKQQKLLLQYFAQLPNNGWRLVFLGDGQYWDEAKETAKKLDIAHLVDFAGNQREIDHYYLRSSIFAFTSISEGFPNALGEAMSAGCACISFDCEAGPADLIDDGLNGFLVPVGEDALYMGRLQTLMQDAGLCARMGKAARQKIQQFDLQQIGGSFYHFLVS